MGRTLGLLHGGAALRCGAERSGAICGRAHNERSSLPELRSLIEMSAASKKGALKPSLLSPTRNNRLLSEETTDLYV